MTVYHANCPVCFQPMVEDDNHPHVFHCRHPLHKTTVDFNPPLAPSIPTVLQPDWTCDDTGHTNSSPAFLRLCDAVEQLIRGDAHQLISGNVGWTARLVVAQLAHKHGLAPTTMTEGDQP